MTGSTCLLDQRPTGDGGHLCRGCTDRLRRDLDAVPDIVSELLVTVSRQDHVQPVRAGRSTATPLVYNPDASDELTDLAYLLGSWSRCMADDLGMKLEVPDTPDTPAAHAAWLALRLRVIRHHPAVDDLAGEIGHAVARGRRAVDVHDVASRFLVGPCPQLTDGWFCDGDVQATITTTRDEPPTMACLRCHHTWRAEQWLRAGKLIANRRDEIGWRPPARTRAGADT
ncbi:hypothetical protein GCM10023201_41090 [Actinomycetospora corticicola]|uniref:Uncharacterized protein n=1 Tax=Actinomycetospora corticicola TaxID=663602 RepID=A0A7Y9J629_9PSEU|nr:hypothetical protein [Actinomycetospora corticicola]NYD36805.1 hypothetical protein [Actinomycetospora corticicola]